MIFLKDHFGRNYNLQKIILVIGKHQKIIKIINKVFR